MNFYLNYNFSMKKLNILTISLIILTFKVSAESFVYITDELDLPIRSDKNFGNNIIRLLPSGTELSLLQSTEDGWAQIQFDDTIGWIKTFYLSSNPSAREELKTLTREYNANKLLISKLSDEKVEFEKQLVSLKQKILDQEAELLAKEAELLAQEAELLAKEAELLAKEAEEKRIEAELKAKDAVKEAEKLAKEKTIYYVLPNDKAEELKKTAEAKVKEAEEKRKLEEEKAKLVEKAKEAEKLAKEKTIYYVFPNDKAEELKKTAQQVAFENEQYKRLMTEEIQAEQDQERLLAIEDQLKFLKSAYVGNIAARVKYIWRYQGAEDDWTAEVYVVQDRDGTVLAVDVRNTNVGNSSQAKSFIDSIERAVYKASPFPAAPDEAVFDKELIFIFSVN